MILLSGPCWYGRPWAGSKSYINVRRVCEGKAQADILGKINELLTRRQDIVRREGIKVYNMPKNADVFDYRYATGFEALIGFLYLRTD